MIAKFRLWERSWREEINFHSQSRTNDFDVCQGWKLKNEQFQSRHGNNIPCVLTVVKKERGICGQALSGAVQGTDYVSSIFNDRLYI